MSVKPGEELYQEPEPLPSDGAERREGGGMTDRLPDSITMGDKYRPAMEMTEPEEVAAYFELLVEHNMRFPNDGESPKTREQAEAMERSNLGYFAGYYSNETRAQVERVFNAAHPIFGAIEDRPPPTAEEAFEIGKRIGEERA